MKALSLARQYPLDFTLQYPPRRAYFKENFLAPKALGLVEGLQDFLLYAHVPFCAAKCFYCNFAVDVRNSDDYHDQYADALVRQLEGLHRSIGKNTRLHGIDIGGGTPTMLSARNLKRLMQAFQPWLAHVAVDNPLSIETTPSIASSNEDRLHVLREGGVSRISLGIQSTNVTLLKAVNRALQVATTEKAIQNLKKAGFHRINADLIFALPGQTEQQWMADLDSIIALNVDSITTYDCLYRGKGRALTKRTEDKPSQEIYGFLYDLAYDRLTAAGFHAPYGSVNFSRHAGETGTSPYFEGRLHKHLPYIGAGNYASTMIDDYWLFAPHGVDQWKKGVNAGEVLPISDCYRLPQAEIMAKQILASLNFGTIENAWFERRFNCDLKSVYGDALDYAQEQGWLEKTSEGYGVAKGKFQHMPEIRSLFYSDQASEWLHILKEDEEKKNYPSPRGSAGHGLVIGKFMPPHTGHDYLLTEAFNRSNGNLTVLVMGRETDPIPPNLRAQWLKASNPDKDIRCVKHNLPVNYEDPDLWDKWVDLIRSNVPQKITTVYASEAYGQELARRLKASYSSVDPDRTRYPVSATMVREDFERCKPFISAMVYDWMKDNWKKPAGPSI